MADLYDVFTHLVHFAPALSDERRQELQDAVDRAFPNRVPPEPAEAPELEPAAQE